MSEDGPATYLREYLLERGLVVDDLHLVDDRYVVTSGSRSVQVAAPRVGVNVVVWALQTAGDVVERFGWPEDDDPTPA